MRYGYARVSTKGQSKNGNSLAEQKLKLIEKGCSEENIYIDDVTGTKMDRPNFNKLMQVLKPGDTLVVTKLDRFARTAAEGTKLIKELLNQGISVHVLNMGLVEDTPTGRLILTVMLAFAEFERDMIVERTQAGKEIAKTKDGFKEGRPKQYTDTQINMALDLLDKHSYTEVAAMTQISKATLVREMRKRKANQLEG